MIDMEFCPYGSLEWAMLKLKDERRTLAPQDVFNLMKDIAQGLFYLHITKGIMHRDLKPDNCLLTNGFQQGSLKCTPQRTSVMQHFECSWFEVSS